MIIVSTSIKTALKEMKKATVITAAIAVAIKSRKAIESSFDLTKAFTATESINKSVIPTSISA